MSPFRKILRLSVGELLAKTLYFLAFVYIARMLGVYYYGVFEFSVSVRAYLLLFADFGLEMWAVREVARGRDVRELLGQVLPLRLLLATATFCVLIASLLGLPNDGSPLKTVLLLLGLTLFTQAISLRWVFLGEQKMGRVALSLVLGQSVFSGAVFIVTTGADGVYWVPVVWLAGEAVTALCLWAFYIREYGLARSELTLRGMRRSLSSALIFGAATALSLVNFNLDSILLGLLSGAMAVGWYAAAYKPVTAALAVAVSYYHGLFPALSQAYWTDKRDFLNLVTRSMHLTSILAIPVAVGGVFLAEPMIPFLFGPGYGNSVHPLQLLAVSGAIVIVRGNFRQGLLAAGKQTVDMRCGLVAVVVNVGLNLVLIPLYSVVGAAWATLTSELLWFALAFYCFAQHAGPVSWAPLSRPLVAGMMMVTTLLTLHQMYWIPRALFGVFAYLVTLFAIGDAEIRSRLGWPQAQAVSKRHSSHVALDAADFVRTPPEE